MPFYGISLLADAKQVLSIFKAKINSLYVSLGHSWQTLLDSSRTYFQTNQTM